MRSYIRKLLNFVHEGERRRMGTEARDWAGKGEKSRTLTYYKAAGLPLEYYSVAERGITFLDCYFVPNIVHFLFNTEWSISI